MIEEKSDNKLNRVLKRAALLSLLAFPGISQAGTGLFALQQKTLSNNQVYYLATLSNPNAYYSHCASYSTLPYVLVTPGAYGNFDGNAAGQTSYYVGKLEKMMYSLRPKCIRVVSIEATGYSVFDFSGADVLPAEPSGTHEDVNRPIRRAASYLREVIRNLQADPAHKDAPRWFLQGGSGSSLYTAKLADVYRTNANMDAAGFKFPVAMILESLPNSGNIWNGCRFSNDISTVKGVINTVYKPIFGYQANPTTFVTACQNIVANPTARNWKFLTGVGLSTYTGRGNRLFIINGANDPIYKDGGSTLADSWTMDKLLIDFAAVTGKCAGQGFMNSSDINAVNRNAFFNCDMNTYAGLYQNGGHGPVDSSNVYAIDDLVNTAIGPEYVLGTIDNVVGNNVNGWACTYASRAPIYVHVYVGGPAGSGTIIGGYASNNPSEAAVGTACSGRGTTYRYSIPLPLAVRQAHVGKKIYIYGIHPTNGSRNAALYNSGVFSVPVP